MKNMNVIMAGFGGQGMLSAGKILAHAAMKERLEVSWLPSYGPEMRGGTANVTVCVSQEAIASPVVTHPHGLIAMNLPSLEKFESKVSPGGLIILNATFIPRKSTRQDCQVIRVDTVDLARKAGSERAANLVVLGVLTGFFGGIPQASLEWAIEAAFTGKRQRWATANVAAFRSGYDVGFNATQPVPA